MINDLLILDEYHTVKVKKIKDHGYYKYGSIEVREKDPYWWQLRALVHESGHGYFQLTREPDAPISEEDFARLFELGVIDLIRNNWQLISDIHEAVS